MTHLYTKTHEWLRIGNDEGVVGITNYAQELLGDLVFIDLPEVGKTIHAGEELGVLESVKAAADFYAPVSGVVTEVNTQLLENPALVNQEPLGQGWLIKLKIANKEEVDNLLDASEYEKITAKD